MATHPNLREGQFEDLLTPDERNTRDVPEELGTAMAAMAEMRQAQADIDTAARTIRNDEMRTEMAKAKALSDYSYKRAKQATEAANKAHTAIASRVQALEAKVNNPVPADDKPDPMASEIRQHVANLTPKQRQEVIDSAIDDGDDRTLKAVLSGPHYLSGMNKQAHANLKTTIAQRRYPQEVRELERLRKAQSRFNSGSEAFVGHVTSMVDHSKVKRAEERHEKANQALGIGADG